MAKERQNRLKSGDGAVNLKVAPSDPKGNMRTEKFPTNRSPREKKNSPKRKLLGSQAVLTMVCSLRAHPTRHQTPEPQLELGPQKEGSK